MEYAELRAKRAELVGKFDKLVSGFPAVIEGTHLTQPVSAHEWTEVEISPGSYVRSVPLHRNGMTILVWEIPSPNVIPRHSHAANETLMVLRGQIHVTLHGEGGDTEHVVGPHTPPLFIPSGVEHSGRRTGRLVAVTTYEPAISIDEVLASMR